MTTTVYGVPPSPYVRKVLITLELKGIEYELNPLNPMEKTPELLAVSPMGKIPALTDDLLTTSDSSVICEYLEERYAEPSIFPASIEQRTRARYLEEYADTRLAEVLGGPLFFERVIKPRVFQQPTDEARVQENIENNIPPVFDYLESIAPEDAFFFGNELSIADIAMACFFLNARYAKFEVDGSRWPALAAYVTRLLDHAALQKRAGADREFFSQAAA